MPNICTLIRSQKVFLFWWTTRTNLGSTIFCCKLLTSQMTNNTVTVSQSFMYFYILSMENASTFDVCLNHINLRNCICSVVFALSFFEWMNEFSLLSHNREIAVSQWHTWEKKYRRLNKKKKNPFQMALVKNIVYNNQSQLASRGSYWDVRTYNHLIVLEVLVQMVAVLHQSRIHCRK